MKVNFKFPLTVNKRSVEFPNSTAMRISICNAPGNQNRGRTRCSDLSHKQKKKGKSLTFTLLFALFKKRNIPIWQQLRQSLPMLL